MDKQHYNYLQITSIMVSFFVMGSIEMVGIASNYIKLDLHLSDTRANLLPSLVYIWFFIITIPAGMLMDKIGRKGTVILSMSVIALSMMMPLLGTSYHYLAISFAIMGMGNVSLQASLYPLLSNIISGKKLAENLTIGQLIKTFSSFSAPYVAMLGALYLTGYDDIGWRIIFVFYFAITIPAVIMISMSKFETESVQSSRITYKDCLILLRKPIVLLAFIGVMCHVGIDISTNILAPKLLMYRLGMTIEKASFGASLYFISRLMGCFLWSILLKRVSTKTFFFISVGLILLAITTLYFTHSAYIIYGCIIVIGLGNANLFPVLFSQAVISMPQKKDDMSALMIMGQAGGALFPYAMGMVYDRIGLDGSISVLFIGVCYLLFYSFTVKNQK